MCSPGDGASHARDFDGVQRCLIYQMFEAVVRDVEQITPLVKRFTLVSPTGAPLPAFSGGSHIIVQMQDGEQRYE